MASNDRKLSSVGCYHKPGIVYRKQCRPHLTQINLCFLLSLMCSYLDSRNLGTVYAITNRTALLCTAKCALQRGTNILKSEIITKWLVFPSTVTYIIDICSHNDITRRSLWTLAHVLHILLRSFPPPFLPPSLPLLLFPSFSPSPPTDHAGAESDLRTYYRCYDTAFPRPSAI